MASVMVSEADPDVRRLLVVLIERLGHEAIALGPDDKDPPRADLLLLEPGAPSCLAQARAARTRWPELPIICMGPVPGDAGFLAEGPMGYLEKPFTLSRLEATLDAASPS